MEHKAIISLIRPTGINKEDTYIVYQDYSYFAVKILEINKCHYHQLHLKEEK